MVKYKTTERIREIKNTSDQMRNSLNKICAPVFWFQKQRSIQEIIDFTKEYSKVNQQLFEEVYRTYPKSFGKAISISEFEIEIK